MALRKCAACGSDLPAGSTARAKYCSATCRKRASRSTPDAPKLTLVPPKADPAPTSRLAALEATAARLDRLLDEADPRSAAALNKEYRDTLRELESLRDVADEGGRGHGPTGGNRRPFNASAV